MRPIRRIVTHNDENGLSYALLDGSAPNDIGGRAEVWMTGPAVPKDDSTEDNGLQSKGLFPAKGGSMLRFFQIPPASQFAHLSVEEKRKAWAELFESMGAADAQPDARRDPGMHKTPTTDYVVLLSGSITLVLDKAEVDLKPFDVVVQRGTNHSWVNKGEEMALLMAVLIAEDS
jgi:mannose-6-phosphate isomerase-like protein (cupin superfamily)